VYFLGIAI
jgi:hypothetical protein